MSNFTEETFNCWVPASALSKGGSAKSADGRRYIQGIASTDTSDLQGETVDPAGIDFGYFVKNGYFNWDHQQDPNARIGEPLDCKVTKNGLWVKGYLYNENKIAEQVWEQMNSLEASKASRKMGFSIEGKVRRRSGKKIEKCWIQNIAITAQPVNTNTWAEIVKSLAKEVKDETKALTAEGSDLVPESLDKEDKKNLSKSYTLNETVVLLKEQYDFGDEAELVAKAVFALVPLLRE